MAKTKRKKSGHPARLTRAEKRRQQHERFKQPDSTEQRVQEINRLMRNAIAQAPHGDGLIVGPLTVAAKYIIPQIQEAFDLCGDEHRSAIETWLLGKFGEVVSTFDPNAYLAWREDCRRRASE